MKKNMYKKIFGAVAFFSIVFSATIPGALSNLKINSTYGNEMATSETLDDENELINVSLYLGPHSNNQNSKFDQTFLSQYANSKIEEKPSYNVQIPKSDIDHIIEELEQLENQFPQIETEQQIYQLLQQKLQLLRDYGILPPSFTIENISKTLEILGKEYNKLFSNHSQRCKFDSTDLLNEASSEDKINNTLILSNSAIGVVTAYASFSFLGNVLPSYTKFMIDKYDLDGDGNTTEKMLINDSSVIPLFAGYNVTLLNAVGAYWINFLVSPSLLTFSYFWALFKIGGELFNSDMWLLGSQLTFSGPGLALSVTVIIQHCDKLIQYTLLDCGLLVSVFNFVGSVWWSEDQVGD